MSTFLAQYIITTIHRSICCKYVGTLYNYLRLRLLSEFVLLARPHSSILQIELTLPSLHLFFNKSSIFLYHSNEILFLSIIVAPHFVLRPVDMTVPVGNTATFQCDAMGVPTPLISWYKSG